MDEDKLKDLALRIVHACRQGDKADFVARNKVMPLIKNALLNKDLDASMPEPELNGDQE